MSLILNTLDAEKFIKYGFDYTILKAEWVKGEKTALLEIEAEVCEDFCYITLDIPNVIYNLINEGLLRKG